MGVLQLPDVMSRLREALCHGVVCSCEMVRCCDGGNGEKPSAMACAMACGVCAVCVGIDSDGVMINKIIIMLFLYNFVLTLYFVLTIISLWGV